MNIKEIIFVLILLTFPISTSAKGLLERQFQYADSLFLSGKYFEAITEFKRLMFFDSANIYKFAAELKIGLSYKGGGKFHQAEKYFAKACKSANNEAETFVAKSQLIRTLILEKKTDEALNEIKEALRNADDNQKRLLYYWRGWAFMFATKWEKAFKEFNSLKENELATVCKKTIEEKYSVNFAKVISYFIPGAGQIYTGNYLSGLMSLGWNVLWGYETVRAFLAERVLDGILVGNLLWFRFYRGNLQNAEKFAIKKNIEIYNKAYGYLENKFKGLKP